MLSQMAAQNGSQTDKHSSDFSTAKEIRVKATSITTNKFWNYAEMILKSFWTDERGYQKVKMKPPQNEGETTHRKAHKNQNFILISLQMFTMDWAKFSKKYSDLLNLRRFSLTLTHWKPPIIQGLSIYCFLKFFKRLLFKLQSNSLWEFHNCKFHYCDFSKKNL